MSPDVNSLHLLTVLFVLLKITGLGFENTSWMIVLIPTILWAVLVALSMILITILISIGRLDYNFFKNNMKGS